MLKKIRLHITLGLLIGFFIYPSINLFANTSSIDSLMKVIRNTKERDLAEKYNKLAKEYYNIDSYDQALLSIDKAMEYANKFNNEYQIAESNYTKGLVYQYDKKDNLKALEFYQLALKSAILSNHNEIKLKSYNSIGFTYYYIQDFQKFKEYTEKMLDIAHELKSTKDEALAYQRLGLYYYFQGDLNKTLEYWTQELELQKILGDKNELAKAYNNLGIIYKNRGEYQKAIEYYQENLKIVEELGDKQMIAKGLSNIGTVYYDFGVDYNKALDFYNKAIKLFAELNDTTNLATSYINIGLIYDKSNDYKSAISNFQMAFKLAQDPTVKALSDKNIGSSLLRSGDYIKAQDFLFRSIDQFNKMGNMKELSSTQILLGETYLKLGNYRKALDYYEQSLIYLKENNLKRETYELFKLLSDVYSNMNEYKQALNYYKNYSELKDSTLNEKYLETVQDMRAKYDDDKKEKEIALQKSRIAEQDAKDKQKNILLYSIVGFLFVVLLFSVLVVKQYNQKRKANIKLEEQNEEIKLQRDQILHQKQEITDSILYASRIQRAILPPEEAISAMLPEYFILFKPRDIVSGDFYYINKKGRYVVFCAADCTGHGVPGAFMSMLGTAFLNEIINKYEHLSSDIILNDLRNYVVTSLHQTGKVGESQDGMDIALCVLDTTNNTLQYSGAHNPLVLIRNGELVEFKADKMPIGIYRDISALFTKHEEQLNEGDTIYIFSDGYVDQFGGADQRKFMKKNFKNLLLEIQSKSMFEQHDFLDETIETWRGNLDQIDDILVIGVRI